MAIYFHYTMFKNSKDTSTYATSTIKDKNEMETQCVNLNATSDINTTSKKLNSIKNLAQI